MNNGDVVRFRTMEACMKWGKYTFENTYVNQAEDGESPYLRDDRGIMWWHKEENLEVVKAPDVTEGWSL